MIEIADRQAIEDILARYNWAFDEGDGEAYAALFSEDGMLTGFGDPFRGRAALADLVMKTFPQCNGKWLHHVNNVTCRYVDGRDRVEAKGYQLVTDWTKAPPMLRMMLKAYWTLVRTGDGWEIAVVDLKFVSPDA